MLVHCDLVICHGGAGSTFGALASGLPVLLLPRGADNFYNADRVVAAGAGRRLVAAEITPQAVAREVTLLLDDERVRASARRIAAEIAEMPSALSLLGSLQALARKGAETVRTESTTLLLRRELGQAALLVPVRP